MCLGLGCADMLFTVHCCGRVSPLSSAASPCWEHEGAEAWGRLIIWFPQKCIVAQEIKTLRNWVERPRNVFINSSQWVRTVVVFFLHKTHIQFQFSLSAHFTGLRLRVGPTDSCLFRLWNAISRGNSWDLKPRFRGLNVVHKTLVMQLLKCTGGKRLIN